MPGKKKRTKTISQRTIYECVTPEIDRLIKSKKDNSPLIKADQKAINMVIPGVEKLLSNTKMTPDLRLRCLCAYFINLNFLYVHAFGIHARTKKNLEPIRRLNAKMSVYSKELFSTLRTFIIDPQNPQFSNETKDIIGPCLVYIMEAYIQMPVYLGAAIYIQYPEKRGEIDDQLTAANEQFNRIARLTTEIEVRLKSTVPVSFGQRKNAFLSFSKIFAAINKSTYVLVNMLHDQLYPPENGGLSFANSLTGVVELYKSDPMLEAYIPGLEHANNALIAASSSSSNAQLESIIDLNDSLDSTIIKMEFQGLMKRLNEPGFDKTLLETPAINAWINHDERIKFLMPALAHYIDTTFPNHKKDKLDLVTPGKIEFEYSCSKVDEIQRCISVVLYFFIQIQSNPKIKNKRCFYEMITLLWDLKCPLQFLLHLQETRQIPVGRSLWWKQSYDFYRSAFEAGYSGILNLFITICLKKSSTGLHPITLELLKPSLYFYAHTLSLFLEASLKTQIFNNEIKKALATVGLLNQLSTLVNIYAVPISKYSNVDIAKVITLQNRISKSLPALKASLEQPADDLMRLAQRLYQLEPEFDGKLNEKQWIVPLPIDIPFEPNAAIFDLFTVMRRHFAVNKTLDGLIPVLVERLPKMLTQWLSKDLGHNLINAKILQQIINTCCKYCDTANLSQNLFKKIMIVYNSELNDFIETWEKQLNATQKPLIKKFLVLLQNDKEQKLPYNEAQTTQQFSTYFQQPSFILPLENELKTLLAKLSTYELGALIHLSAVGQTAKDVHKETLMQLYLKVNSNIYELSFQEAKEVYSLWDDCIPYFMQLMEVISEEPSTVVHYRDSVVNMKFKEAIRYYVNAQIDQARAALAHVQMALVQLGDQLSENETLQIVHEMNIFQEELADPNSMPRLLAYTYSPHQPEEVRTELVPPTTEHPEFNREHRLRFQNAWQKLALTEDKFEAKHIFDHWLKHLRDFDMHPETRGQLESQWKQHFKQMGIRLKAAKPPVVVHKPVSKPMIQIAKPEKSKIDWKAIDEERRLQQIEAHNQARIESLARQKEERKLKQKLIAEQEAALKELLSSTVPLEEVPLAITPVVADCVIADEECAPEIEIPNTRQLTFFSKNRSSYVKVAKGLDVHGPEFPALPSIRVPVSSSSVEMPVSQETLKPVYKMPKRVQDIMNSLALNNQAYVTGGAVLKLMNDEPEESINDWDLATTCSPKDMLTLVPNSLQINNDPPVFKVLVPDGEPPIDITCYPDYSLEKIVKKKDFTVNAFFITAKGELLAPLPASFDHLKQKSLKTIIDIDTSFNESISRLWRMIRLNNQFGWFLGEDEKNGIRQHVHRLCDFSMGQFIIHFKKCFLQSKTQAFKNLDTFQELGLFRAMFARPNEHLSISEGRLAFCKDKLKQLFIDKANTQFVDTIVLFTLLLERPSIEAYQQRIDEWIALFQAREHNPAVIQSLKSALPERLNYYCDQLAIPEQPEQQLVVDQDRQSSNVQAQATHFFWNQPQPQPSSSGWVVPSPYIVLPDGSLYNFYYFNT